MTFRSAHCRDVGTKKCQRRYLRQKEGISLKWVTKSGIDTVARTWQFKFYRNPLYHARNPFALSPHSLTDSPNLNKCNEQ